MLSHHIIHAQFCLPRSLGPSSPSVARPVTLAPAALAAALAAAYVPLESAAAFSSLTCRSTRFAHFPAATAPHTLCDGRNLVLRPALMGKANCPRNRAGYQCDGEPVRL